MGALTPALDRSLLAELGDERHHFPDRVKEQVDIRRIVHIGLYHKRVTAGMERLFFVFFTRR